MSDYRSIYESKTPMTLISKFNIFVPIPKPGDKVSFPVACVTGVCFNRFCQNDHWRWNVEKSQLENWLENKWHSVSGAVVIDGTVTVVEEPKPEPVWKDCNFVEAVEWMKKQLHKPVARWEGSEYYMVTSAGVIRRQFDGALIYDVVGGQEVNYFLGKWQIKVDG